MSGLVLDLSKAFNTIPRVPTLGVARLLGVSQQSLVGWAGALSTLSRRFVIRGSVSPPGVFVLRIPGGVRFIAPCYDDG